MEHDGYVLRNNGEYQKISRSDLSAKVHANPPNTKSAAKNQSTNLLQGPPNLSINQGNTLWSYLDHPVATVLFKTGFSSRTK